MAKKTSGINNSDIIAGLDGGFSIDNDTNVSKKKENKKNSNVVSSKRTTNKENDKENIEIPEDLLFLLDKTENKASKAIYIDEEGRSNLSKLSYLLDTDIRQLNSNIVKAFFEQNQPILQKLLKAKMNF